MNGPTVSYTKKIQNQIFFLKKKLKDILEKAKASPAVLIDHNAIDENVMKTIFNIAKDSWRSLDLSFCEKESKEENVPKCLRLIAFNNTHSLHNKLGGWWSTSLCLSHQFAVEGTLKDGTVEFTIGDLGFYVIKLDLKN